MRLAYALATLLLTATAAQADTPKPEPDLDRLSYVDGRALLADGRLSSEAWVRAALARIEAAAARRRDAQADLAARHAALKAAVAETLGDLDDLIGSPAS